MRFTLELKDKQVKETALDAEAQKVRAREAAEAAANEQIIAARAQEEEAMKHVLPFKQKQIEQRQLGQRPSGWHGIRQLRAAQARRIEANGEAGFAAKSSPMLRPIRLDCVGKVASEQMAREGALISKHPLLIQKTMADKLSDKISVIIAPLPPMAISSVPARLVRRARQGGNDREEQVSRCGQRQRQGGRIMLLSSTLAAAARPSSLRIRWCCVHRDSRAGSKTHVEPGAIRWRYAAMDFLQVGTIVVSAPVTCARRKCGRRRCLPAKP